MSQETWQVCWVWGSHTGRQDLEGRLQEGSGLLTRCSLPHPHPFPPPASPECKLVVMFLHPFRCDHSNAEHRLREKVLLSH